MAVTRRVQGLVGAVILIAASAGAYQFAKYKTQAEQRPLLERITELEVENADLKLSISEQNAAVRAAEERAKAAADARATAQRHAETLASFSQSRMDKLQRAIEGMESCGEVLRQYWELRQ